MDNKPQKIYWRFLSSFCRDDNGNIVGGDINDIYNCFTF